MSYTANLCKELAKDGCEVTLLTSTPYEFDAEAKNFCKVNSHLLSMSKEHFYLKFKLLWALDRFYRAWNNACFRNKTADKCIPDIIHIQLVVPVIDVFYLWKLAKKHKVVYTVHDVTRHTGGVQNSPNLLERMYKAVDHIIVHTENNKVQLSRQFGITNDKVTVIPHGVEKPPAEILSRSEAREKLGLLQKSKILLFFGSIRYNKGLDVLLKAIPSVLIAHPDR